MYRDGYFDVATGAGTCVTWCGLRRCADDVKEGRDMSMLRRREGTVPTAAAPEPADALPAATEPHDLGLRDELDPDPLVEEAVERMRRSLSSLVARDEWGRELAWRQVARIAIGPLLTRLRDAQTTTQLLDATRPGTSGVPPQDRSDSGSGWPGDALFWGD
jgi:hypothetical protein